MLATRSPIFDPKAIAATWRAGAMCSAGSLSIVTLVPLSVWKSESVRVMHTSAEDPGLTLSVSIHMKASYVQPKLNPPDPRNQTVLGRMDIVIPCYRTPAGHPFRGLQVRAV